VFVGGSAAWLPGDADLPATSDVDVMAVTGATRAPPKLGKIRFGGALLEITYLPSDQLASSDQVLSSCHLAGSLRTNPTIRLRHLAVGTQLGDYGHARFHEELLALLGCGHLTRERVERHHEAMTAVFVAAAAVARTAFPFASDLTAED
jgi:hypothetical protein